MQLSDFRYELPPELIAQYPPAHRTDSRLLHLKEGGLSDLRFGNIIELLRPSDLLVLNDTRVMRARLFGRKETGGRVEVLIERLLDEGLAVAQVRASKPPKAKSRLRIGDSWIVVEGREDGFFLLRANSCPWRQLMADFGHMPLPPYLQRPDDRLDEDRYQTVYARQEGAVAAPTAGLHFDRDLLDRVVEKGVELAEVTLHVGAGTFQPVRVEDISTHVMHSERVEVSECACERIRAVKSRGGRVIAIGTTCVRSLESAVEGGEVRPYRGETRLFITPGYEFQAVDALITNFHLPESTLLMLVCAFAGYQETMAAYRHAVQQGYRFFSYGDALFIEPEQEKKWRGNQITAPNHQRRMEEC